jgi:hypothetical protein
MNLEKNTIVTLNNGERYFVVSIAQLDNKRYALLINEKNYKDYKFCYEQMENNNIKLIVVKDLKQQAVLFKLFINDINKSLDEINQ